MTNSVGQNAATRIAPTAAEAMREAIDETGGREVFFSGTLDGSGLVSRVRVLARGHDGAVPAVFEGLEPRDVVIHNHPSGGVQPSDADLDLAVVYSHNGHGVYIVDNLVEQVYVVIEPFRDRDRSYLDAEELARALGPGSRIANALPVYEARPQQRQMMEQIAAAFNDDAVAAVEAPTGVGKTLAYLLPAIYWSIRNRERVVVSTRTINLQEQIIEKDLPILERALDLKFSAALVKGRSNYLCPRRLERALSEASLFDDNDEKESLQALVEWAEHSSDGSRSDLPFVPRRELWERVCSEADTCTPAQCMQQRNCFLTKARREIAKADVLVVNHHILFSDLAIKREVGSFSSVAVLPAFQRLVLDEAHHIEDSATEYFGKEATLNGSLALLGRFLRQDRGRERGLLPFIKLRLVRDVPRASSDEAEQGIQLIDNALLPGILAAREAFRAAFGGLRAYTAERCGQIGRDIKWRFTPDVVSDETFAALYEDLFRPACEELRDLAQHAKRLGDIMREIAHQRPTAEDPLSMESQQLRAYTGRLERLASTLSETMSPAVDEAAVRWAEIDAEREQIVRLVKCPIDVGTELSEWLYPNMKTIAMTSATLTVNQSFDFFRSRIGLDKIDTERYREALLDTPFSFDEQAVLCVQSDAPHPNDTERNATLCPVILRVMEHVPGGAFILFTSYRALEDAYRRLETSLRDQGLNPLKQGTAPRARLLDRFRTEPRSVLFGTDSFWEGVDVAGDALQCVILARLPFRVPTEPVLQARTEAIERAGGNAFMRYSVPMAVLKFRQGFGRLIRRRSDRGAVVVLDPRIHSQRYGRTFLGSLPNVPVIVGDANALVEGVASFFETSRAGKAS